jgi:hypothetical protein
MTIDQRLNHNYYFGHLINMCYFVQTIGDGMNKHAKFQYLNFQRYL